MLESMSISTNKFEADSPWTKVMHLTLVCFYTLLILLGEYLWWIEMDYIFLAWR